MKRRAGARLHLQARDARQNQRRSWNRPVKAILVGYVVFCAVVIVVLSFFVPPSVLWFFSGFASGAALLLVWVAIDTPEAARLESAAFAEENTSREIQKLSASGWHVFDNVTFEKCDVDHVAIGPGGVVVLDTKWTSLELFDSRSGRPKPYARHHVGQIRQNARRISAVLSSNGYSGGVDATGVVVWGSGQRQSHLPIECDDTTFVAGQGLRTWLKGLPVRLTTGEVAVATSALARFVEVRDAHDARKRVSQ